MDKFIVLKYERVKSFCPLFSFLHRPTVRETIKTLLSENTKGILNGKESDQQALPRSDSRSCFQERWALGRNGKRKKSKQ